MINIFVLCFRRADFGMGAISVMAERESVIDFTVPYYDLVGVVITIYVHIIYILFTLLSIISTTYYLQ